LEYLHNNEPLKWEEIKEKEKEEDIESSETSVIKD
jgi:hypothetical protein